MGASAFEAWECCLGAVGGVLELALAVERLLVLLQTLHGNIQAFASYVGQLRWDGQVVPRRSLASSMMGTERSR